MERLNEIGEKILINKAKKFDYGKDFSIVFLGDTHIDDNDADNPEKKYILLLKKIISLKSVYAIIHGGDCGKYASILLERFIDDTKSILKYDNIEIKDKNKKPLFLNIGNHDYKLRKTSNRSMKEYERLVGDGNDIIKLFYNSKGPKIAIILLNTGYGKRGTLPDGKDFKNELGNLSKKISNITEKDDTVKFIIDMHIPPQIPDKLHSSHVLNDYYNDAFNEFLGKNASNIIAIVSHHEHGVIQDKAYNYTFETYENTKCSLPLYLTAQGGHSNYIKSSNEKARYSFYKMRFVDHDGSYKLNSVYRYDMVKTFLGIYFINKSDKL